MDENEDIVYPDVEVLDGIDAERLSNAKAARDAVIRLTTFAKGLHEAGQAGDAVVEKIAADLTTLEKRLNELSVQAQMAQDPGGSLGDLRYYRGAKVGGIFSTEAIRWYGGDSGAGYEPGLLDDVNARTAWQREVQEAVEAFRLVALIRGQSTHAETINNHTRNKQLAPKSWKRVQRLMENAPAAIAKAFTDSSGSGGEFIPTELRLPEIERELQLLSEQMLLGVFETRDMAAKVEVSPVLSSHPVAYKYGAVSSDDPTKYTATTPGTSERTATAVSWAARVILDADAEEDAVVSALPEIRSLIVRSLAISEEVAILHGDLASSHQDAISTWNPANVWPSGATLGGSNDPRRLWEGLRAHSFDLSNTRDASGALTYAAFMGDIADLDPPHGLDGNIVCAVSQKVYLKYILTLSEVTTLEKYGAEASILSGEVARVGPARIVKSFLSTDDLAATGLYTGSGSTGSYTMFNRSRFVRKVRRGASVQTKMEIEDGTFRLVGSQRGVFHNRDAATVKNAKTVFNFS
jgi:hypothetical protein